MLGDAAGPVKNVRAIYMPLFGHTTMRSSLALACHPLKTFPDLTGTQSSPATQGLQGLGQRMVSCPAFCILVMGHAGGVSGGLQWCSQAPNACILTL